jgi:glycosyltransferase involved in cell wall biosynthesis
VIFGIDIRPALKKMTGVGTYIHYLSRALIEYSGNDYFKLFSASYKDRYLHPLPERDNYRLYDKKLPVKLTEFFFNDLRFPPIELFIGSIDLFHSPSPILPPIMKGKQVLTVHDLFFLKAPGKAQRQSRTAFRRLIAKHLERADRIISVSRYTANEVMEIFNVPEDKISVIYHGCDHVHNNEKSGLTDDLKNIPEEGTSENILRRLNFPEKGDFILFVGTIEPRKNPELLLSAFERLAERYKKGVYLIIAGDFGWETGFFRKKLESSKDRDKVIITGYLDRNILIHLYRSSKLLVMPSRQEGFGLPVIEAMELELPVIASKTSSLSEIGSDAVFYFEKESAEDLAAKMEKLLEDADLRREMIDRGRKRAREFTWEKSAMFTLEAYREAFK